MDKETQKGYLTSKEGYYRALYDILVAQGRLPEAQQVNRLLKDEELFDYVRRDPAQAKALDGRADLTTTEQAAYADYLKVTETLTVLGARQGELRKKPTRTIAENAELESVNAQLGSAATVFDAFTRGLVARFAKPATQSELPVAAAQVSQAFRADLKEMSRDTKERAVAVYTVLSEKQLTLMVVTPETQIARQIPVNAEDVRKLIADFRATVDDSTSGTIDPRPLGKKLYDLLIKPIQGDLDGAGATVIMWSLDDTLRYLPLGALYDGKQYLAERYAMSVFTLASNSRLKDAVTPWNALAAGVTKASPGFAALPSVGAELSGIVNAANGGSGVLPGALMQDAAFTRARLAAALGNDHNLVHIASHFSFAPGDETKSFLLLGGDAHLPVSEIKTLGGGTAFAGVELLTLSACNTATGGAGANGREVESFAVIAQTGGAKAVLATLWPVADASTARLMQTFYQIHVAEPTLPKTQALRKAQLTLLRGSAAPGTKSGRGAIPIPAPDKEDLDKPPYAVDPKHPYAHPYYWAPFLLIGNWK